jgi:hypothetical protein
MRQRPEDESVMLCVLVPCETLTGSSEYQCAQFDQPANNDWYSRSVSENRRKQLSLCTLRVAIAYTEGDNGRVLRR